MYVPTCSINMYTCTNQINACTCTHTQTQNYIHDITNVGVPSFLLNFYLFDETEVGFAANFLDLSSYIRWIQCELKTVSFVEFGSTSAK